MAVLNMAPHHLSYKSATEGYDDENGDWVNGTEYWIENYCKCDCVPAGKANVISLPDGSVQSYSYTVYLPKKCRDFEYGDIVRINGKDFKVLGFHRYQLQCKIWI